MVVTVSDLQKARSIPDFILQTVNDWLGSSMYSEMQEAKKYYLGENPVLKRRWNKISLDTGGIIDLKPRQNIYSKLFGRLTKQLVNRLLYHDIALDDDAALLKMGKMFQASTRSIAFDAVISSIGWGFWERIDSKPLPATNFIPIVNDDTNIIEKGIYFWQLAANRPMKYQLFETDGVTTWQQDKQGDKLTEIQGKTPYRYKEFKWNTPNGTQSQITSIENYDTLPIVPMYANEERRSELDLPIKTKINAYDLLFTFYGDEFLKGKFIYWLISGYSGDVDELLQIKETAQKLGIIAGGDGSESVTPSKFEPPHEAFDKIREALKREIFSDAMLFNPDDVAGSAHIATAIKAGQYPEDIKANGFGHEVEKYVRAMMPFAGVESRAVTFNHFTLQDGESISRRLQGWIGEVPTEELIKYEPLFQERQNEIADAIARQGLGYMEGGISDLQK